MKYKHVFFIWLIADAFLAFGLMAFTIYQTIIVEGDSDAWGMFLLIGGCGIIFSLPSLILMLLFHWAYTTNAKDKTDHKPYIFLIVGINVLYMIAGQIGMHMLGGFNLFFMGSTLAGLLAFYLVDRKIKKVTLAVSE